MSDFIKIQLQDGPIKENGVNGCQIDDVIRWCHETILGFDTKDGGRYACEENKRAMDSLVDALRHLGDRTRDRETRNVEGTAAA